MRGLGAFQMAQMKHRDARVAQLCQHLHQAIDLLEQIATVPFREPEKPAPPSPPPAPPVVMAPAPEKLIYTIKEARAALGVGTTTLYKEIAEGRLATIKLGSRTLIPGDALRAWVAALPPTKRT